MDNNERLIIGSPAEIEELRIKHLKAIERHNAGFSPLTKSEKAMIASAVEEQGKKLEAKWEKESNGKS